MKALTIIFLLTIVLSLNSFGQADVNIDFRVERQAMSTPMTPLYDMFFMHYYHARPINIKFDGTSLNMFYDNGVSFLNTELTEIERELDVDNDILLTETILYTNNKNVSDTITMVIDYHVGYLQVILPTRNSQDDYVGYTSYREFVGQERLAQK